MWLWGIVYTVMSFLHFTSAVVFLSSIHCHCVCVYFRGSHIVGASLYRGLLPGVTLNRPFNCHLFDLLMLAGVAMNCLIDGWMDGMMD